MSGGEQQMLAIGRALMARPQPAAAGRAVARPRAGDRRQDLRDHPRDQRAGHDDPARRAERQLRARRLPARLRARDRHGRAQRHVGRTCATTRASRTRTSAHDRRPRSDRRQGTLAALHLAASAIACQWLAAQKGYSEKAGLGTGLLLSALGVPIWLLMRAEAEFQVGQPPRAPAGGSGTTPGDGQAPGDAPSS